MVSDGRVLWENLKRDVEKCYKITEEQGKGQVAKFCKRRGKPLKIVQLSSGTPWCRLGRGCEKCRCDMAN